MDLLKIQFRKEDSCEKSSLFMTKARIHKKTSSWIITRLFFLKSNVGLKTYYFSLFKTDYLTDIFI